MFKKKTTKEKYQELDKKIKELSKERDLLKKELMKDLENVLVYDKTSVDSKLLEVMFPDAYAKCLKISQVRRLKL
jgi:hypothetical protein